MRYTLILAALAYAFGIALGEVAFPGSWMPAMLIAAAALLLITRMLPEAFRRRVLLAVVFLVGAARGTGETDFPAWLSLRAQGITEVRGEVTSYPAIGQETISFTLRPDSLPADLRVTWRVEVGDLYGRIILGDRVRVEGPVRLPEPFEGFDYPTYLRRRGIFATIYVEGSSAVQGLARTSEPFGRMGDAFRQQLVQRFREHLSPQEAALAQGLLLGDRSGMSDAWVDRFEMTGLMHILAVSGLHLGIVLAGAWFGLRLLGLRPLWAYPLVGMLVLGFLWVVGPRVSLIRASLMFAFLGLGSVLADAGWIPRRSIDPANGLAAAAITILALSPGQLFESGFQLSFAATAGILVAFRPWMRTRWLPSVERMSDRMPKGLQRTARALLTLAVVSLGAQAGAAPVVIWHFGTIHPWLVFANLLVVPLVTIAIWSGLVGLLGLLLEAGAIVLAPFAWMLATLAGLVSGLSSLPGAALEASRWVGLWLGGLVGFVTLLAYVSSSSRTWYSTSMTSSSVEEG